MPPHARREKREGNARRRRSVSRICVSTSLMPTPGPPLREREGMMRRGRVAPPAFEVEAEEEPGWEEGSGDESDGPPADEAAFAFAVTDIATATLAGSVVDADARRGIQRGQGLGKLVAMEKRGRLGSASSPLSLVPPAPIWYSLCGSVVNDGEDPPLRCY